jgi:hypothetical protein
MRKMAKLAVIVADGITVSVRRNLKRKKEQEARQKRGQHSMCSASQHWVVRTPPFSILLRRAHGGNSRKLSVPVRQRQVPLNLQDIPIARDHLIEHRAHDTTQE